MPEDPWGADIREMEWKNDTSRIDWRTGGEEDTQQDAISKEVLEDIWIKEGSDWDLGGIEEGHLGSQRGNSNC